MPAFNPAIPVNASIIASDELRDNFNALKGLIDAIPAAPPTLKSGVGNLDGNGQLDLSGLTSAPFAVGAWYGGQGNGQIITLGAPLRIASSSGPADAGYTVCWVAF